MTRPVLIKLLPSLSACLVIGLRIISCSAGIEVRAVGSLSPTTKNFDRPQSKYSLIKFMHPTFFGRLAIFVKFLSLITQQFMSSSVRLEMHKCNCVPHQPLSSATPLHHSSSHCSMSASNNRQPAWVTSLFENYLKPIRTRFSAIPQSISPNDSEFLLDTFIALLGTGVHEAVCGISYIHFCLDIFNVN